VALFELQTGVMHISTFMFVSFFCTTHSHEKHAVGF